MLEEIKSFRNNYPNGEELIKEFKVYAFDDLIPLYPKTIEYAEEEIASNKNELEQQKIDPNYKDKAQILLDRIKAESKNSAMRWEVKIYPLQNKWPNQLP